MPSPIGTIVAMLALLLLSSSTGMAAAAAEEEALPWQPPTNETTTEKIDIFVTCNGIRNLAAMTKGQQQLLVKAISAVHKDIYDLPPPFDLTNVTLLGQLSERITPWSVHFQGIQKIFVGFEFPYEGMTAYYPDFEDEFMAKLRGTKRRVFSNINSCHIENMSIEGQE